MTEYICLLADTRTKMPPDRKQTWDEETETESSWPTTFSGNRLQEYATPSLGTHTDNFPNNGSDTTQTTTFVKADVRYREIQPI